MPISFNSYVYLNLMPRVIDSPKQTIDCAKEGQFIVQIRINSPSLPKDTSIGNVWVHTDGNWWSGAPNVNEARSESAHLVMMARGCPPPSFLPGAMVDVVLEIKYSQITKHLRSPPVKLETVH